MLQAVFCFTVAFAFAFAYDIFTLNNGKPVDDAVNSQTLNSEGPILLQDYELIERLQIHNRERIPERNVHARGAVAKGSFTCSADVSNMTFARFLTPGTVTPVAVRFSTVIHGRDSPEFLRDPRGFAIKFYTQEGNYDIVGLSFPIFFIRDGIRFPEMIRSLKPNPVTGVQEWWRIWDYFANFPESTHMFTWLLDDVGIPASYREMDGWGVHTYKWISPKGEETWVRYYYKSAQGVKSLQDDEAVKKHFSFATTDLFQAIQRGDYPKWTVQVQTLNPKDPRIANLSFDVLDTTKQWPFDLFPPQTIGELVLNENVISQFLENEMIAFSPARMIPGIEPSDEKMLQTRLFAYADTQRYRLGVNNQMLPINRPRCPFRDDHIDGYMNFMTTDSPSANEINYFPSTLSKVHTVPHYPHESQAYSGKKVRQMISKTDDFEQAGARFRSFPEDRQHRLAQRIAGTLSEPRVTDNVKNIWMSYWTKADPNLADLIRKYMKP